MLTITFRNVAQFGRALRLGRKGPRFKSLYSDKIYNHRRELHMHISLRQARKIVEKINGVIGSIDTNTTIGLNVWDLTDVTEALDSAQLTLVTNIKRVVVLQVVRATLRSAIDSANHDSGISVHIAARKQHTDQIAFIKSVIDNTPNAHVVSTSAGITAKIAQLTEKSAVHSYGRDDSIVVSLLTDNIRIELEQTAISLQRDLDKIENQLLELNVSTTIKLIPTVVSTLQAENLV